jgi:hypothetical protein
VVVARNDDYNANERPWRIISATVVHAGHTHIRWVAKFMPSRSGSVQTADEGVNWARGYDLVTRAALRAAKILEAS